MYRASDAFFAKLKKSARIEHIRGSINNVPIDDRNIIALNYNNRSSDSKDVSIGYAYIGQITATFVDVNIPRGGWRDSVITLEYGLEIGGGEVEYIPIGVFTVTQAQWSDSGISITASDNMAKFDKVFNIDQTSGKAFDLFTLACTNCGLTFELTEEEADALPNGTEIFGLYPNNDIKTYRDFVAWLSQAVGGFVTATRTGSITVRSYLNLVNPVDTLTARDRILGSVFSDYETLYDGVSFTSLEDQQTYYYSVNKGEGSVINLGSNPLMQYGTEETKQNQRYLLAWIVYAIKYTPFNIAVLNTPIYDLGDVISCVGGVAGSGELRCCIMSIDWNFKQTTSMVGYGADPSLATGKNKTDKVISGILKNTKDELVTYTYVNASEIELERDVEVSVINIKFATLSPKIVDFWAEIDLNAALGLEEDIQIEARYYIDGVMVPEYQPQTSWNNSGMHLMHLLAYLETLEANSGYTFEVRLVLKSGLATIAPQNIHAVIKGQGLAAVNDWNGQLEFKDAFTLRDGRSNAFEFTVSDISFDTQVPIGAAVSDEFGLVDERGNIFEFADRIRITTQAPEYELITEDDQLIYTESENYIVTEK